MPFADSYPFVFGFANFVLSMALCFLAFGLWLRLGRLGHLRLRALLFAPLSIIVWLAHTFGWGVLGIMAFSAELVRQLDRERTLPEAALRAAVHCLALVPPLILMIVWRSGDVAGKTEHWLAIVPKVNYLLYALRDRWKWIDVPSMLLVLGLLAVALRSRSFGFSRNLAASALLLLLIYLLLPQRIFGSSYADMRLLPYTIALGLLAIRTKQAMPALAAAGLLFVALRIGAETISFGLYGRAFDAELTALDHVPPGARMISLIGTPCRGEWTMTRSTISPGSRWCAAKPSRTTNGRWRARSSTARNIWRRGVFGRIRRRSSGCTIARSIVGRRSTPHCATSRAQPSTISG